MNHQSHLPPDLHTTSLWEWEDCNGGKICRAPKVAGSEKLLLRELHSLRLHCCTHCCGTTDKYLSLASMPTVQYNACGQYVSGVYICHGHRGRSLTWSQQSSIHPCRWCSRSTRSAPSSRASAAAAARPKPPPPRPQPRLLRLTDLLPARCHCCRLRQPRLPRLKWQEMVLR